jgi:hypothetical protein
MKLLLFIALTFGISANAAILVIDCNPTGTHAEGKITEVKVWTHGDNSTVGLGMKNSGTYRIEASTTAAALQLASMLNDDVNDRIQITLTLDYRCESTSSYTLKFQN